MSSDATPPSGMLLGYARESLRRPARQPRPDDPIPVGSVPAIDEQIDMLTDAGVDARRVYSDRHTADARPGLAALLDYARGGDVVVVVGIDRLGRTTGEVMRTASTLAGQGLGLRSLREGVDTRDPAGAMIVGVLASLANLDADTPPDRRPAPGTRHGSSTAIGRPRALDPQQVTLAERMRANGDSVPTIAEALGVSRATLYRTLAERRSTR